ncbi:SURF1 family cytochrome oxidase biogenesis protein [Actinopolymorpha singaporensis]
MYRFLLRPRWLAMMVAVVIAAAVCVELAGWQLHRLEARRAHNALVTSNSGVSARPVGYVLAPGRSVGPGKEYAQVKARGTYDARHQILVRYRPLQGEPGFNVLTPLRLAGSRNAVVVNRGWIPSLRSTDAPRAPAPPAGEVTVIARVRASEAADRPEKVIDGQVRFIQVRAISAVVPYPLLGDYVELARQVPAQRSDLPRMLPPPELSEGPHLAYAFQWYMFALIAVAGGIFLAYDEAHDGRLRERLRNMRVEPNEPRQPRQSPGRTSPGRTPPARSPGPPERPGPAGPTGTRGHSGTSATLENEDSARRST